jgi:hypothetical protein
MGLRDGRSYVLADSEPPDSPDYSRQAITTPKRIRSLFGAWRRMNLTVVGPLIDPLGRVDAGVMRWFMTDPGRLELPSPWIWMPPLESPGGAVPVALHPADSCVWRALLVFMVSAWQRKREEIARIEASERHTRELVDGSPNWSAD